MGNATPAELLQKALYVFNFLNCSLMDPNPLIVRHFGNNPQKLSKRPQCWSEIQKQVRLWDLTPSSYGEKGMLVSPQKMAWGGFQPRTWDFQRIPEWLFWGSWSPWHFTSGFAFLYHWVHLHLDPATTQTSCYLTRGIHWPLTSLSTVWSIHSRNSMS